MSPVLQSLLYAAAPTAAIPGAAVAVSVAPPGPRLRSVLQHFAAGGLLAVIAVELLGRAAEQSTLGLSAGIALGTVFMLALDATTRRLESRGGALASVGFLATVTVDFLLDGLLLGVSLRHDAELGLLLAVALTLEDVVTGLSVATAVRDDLGSRRLIPVVAGVALAFPLGAVLGAVVGGVVTGAANTGVLAFAAVALLFLVVEELLREAHEVREAPWMTSALFAGLLAFLLLENVV